MQSTNFTSTVTVKQTPTEVYEAINNVRHWWTGDIDSRCPRRFAGRDRRKPVAQPSPARRGRGGSQSLSAGVAPRSASHWASRSRRVSGCVDASSADWLFA